MNELTLDGKIYVSSKQAAEITGYAKDYVGQLCREGRVEARLVGRNWYILKSAIEKHRFATAGNDSDTSTDAPVQAAVDSWDRPHYKRDDSANLPAIHSSDDGIADPEELTETDIAPQSTVEAMQEAWRGWFSSMHTGEEHTATEVEEHEIVEEALESATSEETAIPMHPIARSSEEHEALNLRRIREYREEGIDDDNREPAPADEYSRPVRAGAGSYRILQAVFILVAIISLSVGYIGSGFAAKDLVSYKPASFLAGVSLYNK